MKVEARSLEEPSEPITRVHYSPKGSPLVGVGGSLKQHGYICAWKNASSSPAGRLIKNGEIIDCLAFSEDGQLFVTAGQTTNTVEIWDTETFCQSRSIAILAKPYRRSAAGHFLTSTHVGAMAFSPESRALAIGCWDLTVKIIDLYSEAIAELMLQRNKHNVDFVMFAAGGKQLVTGTSRHLVTWDLATLTSESSVDLGGDGVWRHLSLTGLDAVFSLSHLLGQVRIFWLGSQTQEQYELQLPSQRISCCLAYSPTLNLIAIGTFQGDVLLWDVSRGKVTGKFRCRNAPIQSVDFAPSESALCVVTASPTNRIAEYTFSL